MTTQITPPPPPPPPPPPTYPIVLTQSGDIQKQHPWSFHDFSNKTTELSPRNFHNYQVDTINFLIANPQEAMLWIFLGGGKSVCALSLLAYKRAFGLKDRMLIVAPKKICELTFAQEAVKWAHTKDLSVVNMCGGAKHRQTTLFTSKADVTLINYESLSWLKLQLETYWIDQGKELPYDIIVFDEVSKMKRPQSIRFKEFSSITPYFKSRIGMTASPASNGIENVWSQFYILDNGKRLGSKFNVFQEQYFRKLDGIHGKWIPRDNDATKQAVVNAVHDMTMILESEGNIDLPPCTIIDREIILPARKMKDYLQLESEFFMELENGGELEIFNSVALSNKLLQVGNGLVYKQEDPEDMTTRTTEYVHDEKYKELETIIDETGDDPILLFYGFTSEKEKILSLYPEAKCLTGTDEKEANDMVNDFNAGKLKIMIAHPASAAHGLNLQYACSTVLWFGMTWNLEFYTQANGRIMRQGQKNPVRIIRILAKDTIEIKIAKRLEEKKMDEDSLKEMMAEIKLERGK